jgi:hypothetical protein
MKMVRTTKPSFVYLALVGLFVTAESAMGLEVLSAGYRVETYATYSCPEMLYAPRGLVFDRDWNLYLSQWQNYRSKGAVFRMTNEKSFTRWLEIPGTPRRIVWTGGTDYGQFLYVTDATLHEIMRIGLDGKVSTFCPLRGGPHSLALDPTGSYGGRLYVATRAPDHIYSISQTGKAQMFSRFPGSVPGGHADLTFDPGTDYGGFMYVAVECGKCPAGAFGGLFRIDQNGKDARFAPEAVSVMNVLIDPYGPFKRKMFVSAKSKYSQPYYSIWRVEPDGKISEFAVATLGDHLFTFTFGPHGAMYVPEYSADKKIVVINRITEEK